MTTILGIDPGYDRLGWAIASISDRKMSLQKYDCIVTNRKQSFLERMNDITAQLEKIIKTYQPSELAIETLVFARNTTTALKVSEIRGSVITTATAHNIETFQYNPMTIKQSVTGYGKADKQGMNKMIRLLLPDIDTVAHDDTMDAIAVALTHALTVHQLQL